MSMMRLLLIIALSGCLAGLAPAQTAAKSKAPSPPAAPAATKAPAAASPAPAPPPSAPEAEAPAPSEPAASSEPAAPEPSPAESGDSSASSPAESAPMESAPAPETLTPAEASDESTARAPVPSPVPERVEATVEEIERYINAPAPARLGREVDEKDKPVALFGDPDTVRRLLGEEPRYVYIPSGEDPMIVPWVRDQVMAAELMIEAQQLYKEGKYEESLAKVRVVIEQFSRTDSLGKAQELRKAIESEIVKPSESEGDAPKITAMKRKFPEWIEKNTSGVIYDESNPKQSKVLVGDFVLGNGDSVPSYAGIKVVHIEKSMVTFDFQGDLHQVPVEGGR